jgi:hypothetical protein
MLRFNLDAHEACSGFRNFPFDDFQWPVGFCHLYSAHLRILHAKSLSGDLEMTPAMRVPQPLNFSAGSFLCDHRNDQFPTAASFLHFSCVGDRRLRERQNGIDDCLETPRLQQFSDPS